MITIIDIIIISMIILLIFLYFYFGRIRGEEELNTTKNIIDDNFDDKGATIIDMQEKKEEDIRNKISIYESDKYKDKYEQLPWEDDVYVDAEDCPTKIMDSSQIFETRDLARKRRENPIIY